MTYREALEKLEQHGQGHVLRFWDKLDGAQRDGLLRQLADLDFVTVGRICELLKNEPAACSPSPAPPLRPAPVASPGDGERVQARKAGEQALRSGKVGVILVAGGQGTRLGYDGPKGTYLLASMTRASLFEIHSRKILALERRYATRVPFYIMTSEGNDAATRRFFEDNRYFGLEPERVRFFAQGTLPAFWPDGRMILEAPGRLFAAPDGHGGILAALDRRGMLDDMERRGLSTLFYFQVDNPLVAIADPVFVGLHGLKGADMSLKVCAKRDPYEGLGVPVVRDGRYAVVEYTEFTDEQKQARQPNGDLLFKYGSVAIHLFSLAFLRREAAAGLPLHPAHKKVAYCDEQGKPVKPDQPNAYKFEKFIFDALPDAATSLLLEFAREEEFAPVKNAEGADSPETARAAMTAKYARWLEACGVAVPRDGQGAIACRIEIDPAYANSAEELKERLPRGFAVRGDTLLA